MARVGIGAELFVNKPLEEVDAASSLWLSLTTGQETGHLAGHDEAYIMIKYLILLCK
jgi:hypothetical protein